MGMLNIDNVCNLILKYITYKKGGSLDSCSIASFNHFSQLIKDEFIPFGRKSLKNILYNQQILKNDENESIIAIIVENCIYLLHPRKQMFIKSTQVNSLFRFLLFWLFFD